MTALVVLAVLVGALAQSVSGIGFSLVCVPFLVAALGAHEGVRLGVVLSLLVNVGLLARYHRDLDRRGALLLLAPAAAATPVAAVAVRALPDRPAQAAAGGVIVFATVLLAAGVRWRAARGAAGAVGVGVVSGVTNVVAGVPGPPVALWADNAGWSAGTTRATLQAYFLGLNVITLLSLGRPRGGTGLLLAAAAALAVGVLLGAPLSARVPQAVARRATLALAAAGGLTVLVRATT